MSLTLVCQEILGISLASTFIIVLQCFAQLLFEKGVIRKKLNYATIACLNIITAVSISNYAVLPLVEPFPSSSRIIGWLTPVVLITGLPLSVVLAALSVLRGMSRIKDVDATGELTHYHSKSLVFKGKNRNIALCILKLVSRSTLDSGPTRKRDVFHKNESLNFGELEDDSFDYSHLTSLWSNVPDFSVEFTIENGLTSVNFFTFAADSDTDRATKLAEEKAEKLRSILQIRFKTKIDFLQGYQLWSAYGLILGRDSPYTIEPEFGVLKIGGIQRSEKRFVAVSALRGKSDTTATMEIPQARVEQFLSTFARERLAASMVIHLEAIAPPSIPSEAKLIEKARNEPDMRVLLELSEKRREVREERHAQLSGYWNISAYIVYRGNTEEETKLLQEKGDACVEAVYSSPSLRVKGEKLEGKRISKRLKNLMFRWDIGITTMKASSRLAAALIQLPERHIVGIPETEIPVFDLPPREELEDGEITIGTVMHDENEICPMRIKLEDLMLHTVVFGETGFGKTRLIMNLLQEMSAYDVAWTLIEMKGEYKPLVKLIDNVVYLRPASKIAPTKINLFDPQTEKPETHAKKIFAILKETFSTLFTDQNRELSAQMERVFYEALVTYMTSTTHLDQEDIRHDEDKTGGIATHEHENGEIKPMRNWVSFNGWLQNYAKRHGLSSLPQIESTIQALLNRLDSFTRNPLNEVFNHDKSNVSFGDLVKRRAIIDLSEIKANGTAEDLRLISNIITKYVATAAQQRGIQDHLRHILIIDDALEVVPEILTKKTTAETGITEQMVLLLRATGQGVIISTQRPNISQNIVANAATKIFLRTTVDSEKAAKWLNLNDEQTNYLKAMPKMEAIIITPKHSKPIRIKTIQIDPPRVDNHDIIVSDMINYPIIYDTETRNLDVEPATRHIENENTMITKGTHLEVKRLKTIAEEAYQAGNYKEALRTYVTAIEAMKN
nr:DUF87 domain-containing protein [Candidatus Njordarchaeum guaymaensis]